MQSWQESPILTRVLKHSLGRRLMTMVGPNLVEKSLKFSGHEFKMLLDLNDRWGVSKYLLKHGDYDPVLLQIAIKIIPRKARVLDVGGNIGFWSVFLGKVCGCEKVWAYEPAPQNVALLKQNLALNGLADIVEVSPCALGETKRSSQLFISTENAGDHQLYESAEKRDAIDIKVEAFDETHPGERVDFIKIDTQGYEPYVLRGLLKTLAHNQDVKIITEFWPHGIRGAGSDPEALLKQLSELGFKFWAVVPNSEKIERASIASIMEMCPGEVHTDLILSRSELQLV